MRESPDTAEVTGLIDPGEQTRIADNDGLRRLLWALIMDERGRLLRGQRLRPALSEPTRDLVIGEDGLGFDSLARLELVSRVNRFFGLHRTGIEDYLLVAQHFGDWVDLVAQHLSIDAENRSACLAFQTSGSTGKPKTIEHSICRLRAEAALHIEMLPSFQRLVALVPPIHIYGFLFTVALPALSGRAVIDLTGRGPGTIAATLRAGDLVVGTPFLWNTVLGAAGSLPEVVALTSAAPMPSDQWKRLETAGAAHIVEVFGSTETAGLGTRTGGDRPFTLLAHLKKTSEGGIADATDDRPLPLQDRVEWLTDRTFRPRGRCDATVQVGGVNVDLDDVARCLEDYAWVRAASVRITDRGPGARLKAFVVPADDAPEPSELIDLLTAHVRERLAPPARPQSYTFGSILPTNAAGKPCDWVEESDARGSRGFTKS